MRLVSPDRVLYVVADKAKLKALVEQLGGRGLGLPGMAAVARWSACVGMRVEAHHSSYRHGVHCHGSIFARDGRAMACGAAAELV